MSQNKDYDNTNSGVLFRNKDKQTKSSERDTSKWSDYDGSINIYGIEFWLSAWVRKAQQGKRKGEKFFSISVEPKNEDEGKQLAKIIENHLNGKAQGGSPPADLSDLDDEDDGLPF